MTTNSDKEVLATVNPTMNHLDVPGRKMAMQVLKFYVDDVELGQMPAVVAYQRLHTTVGAVMESFRQQFDITGTRYWFHPESESYFTTGPHETISDAQAQECVELSRKQWFFDQDEL